MLRIEEKFILNQVQVHKMRSILYLCATVDKHAIKNNLYPVFSTYYDTKLLDMFYEKINGELKHKKIRLRSYCSDINKPTSTFLEAKLKHNKRQFKIRVKLDIKNAANLELNELFISDKSTQENNFFAYFSAYSSLIKSCSVYYEREAYLINLDNKIIRINFDHNITPLTPKEQFVTAEQISNRSLMPFGKTLMEIKYDTNTLPQFITRELYNLGIERTSFSKYTSSILKLIENNNCLFKGVVI